MQELILVVDDESKILKLTRDYLEKDGFRVLSAPDGATALTMARRERPDLVVLDLMLPEMDGWEVCRVLRRKTDIPIIMLTARAEESDQVVGQELGADDYVTVDSYPVVRVQPTPAGMARLHTRLVKIAVLRKHATLLK